MKQRLLLFILSISMLAGQMKATNCSRSSNPFIGVLIDSGVLLHEKPVFDNSTCGEEWKKRGTCCEAESLRQYALKEVSEFKNASHYLRQQISSITGAIYAYEFFHMLKLTQAKASTKDKSALARIESELQAAEEKRRRVKGIQENLQPYFEKMKKEQQCVDRE